VVLDRPLSKAKAFKGRCRHYAVVIRWWAGTAWSHWRWLAYNKWGKHFARRYRGGFRVGSNVVRGRRVQLKALHKTWAAICADPRIVDHGRWVSLGCGVVRAFLTKEWFDQYVMPEGKKGVLTIDESAPVNRERTLGRIVDFAQVLYNLQHTFGFDECLARLYEGNIEGTLAELDLGRMLYINRVPFRFIIPTGRKKSDYDTEILYSNGLIACADAKCKIETTNFTENGIRNVLKDAREQLPNDKPGIVFVKVPARWLGHKNFADVSIKCARRFLGGVPRIVSVKYYASPVVWHNNMLMIQHAFKEVSNPRTNFGNDVDWNIFKAGPLPSEWSGAPPWWQRIFYFPDGKPR
jgi:hypothetical protein